MYSIPRYGRKYTGPSLFAATSSYRSPTLGDGWAYLVPSESYKEHLSTHTKEEDMSNCSGFAAMFLANLKNVKGLRVSGVGGVCCGRHRVWRGNGLGDLQRGERYANMDFVFWSSIRGEEYLCIVVSYDIACQWSRNFWARMDALDPSIKIQYTTRGIVFMTHGEVVEEGWAQSNKAAAQTKEMGPGTQAMTLDDIFGFCNWQTIQNLDFKRFDTGLEKALSRKVLNDWEQLVKDWEEDHSRLCPYEISEGEKIENFFKKMQLKLAEDEHEKLACGEAVHSSSLCLFVVQGIELQEAQRSLELFILTNKSLTPSQQLEVQKRRSSLLKRIQQFRSIQALLMPRLSDVLSP
ncbi:hypothetical protein K435DRAFT_866334 [Dendrothele bispora CBS 962.96]|uniref:Uncharacterized protein n=1 Tax=Dendrothele bispora (strain CBS 962.96) TaxID=1314807 RepID=A0A4S8LHV6_DENBC|nr:hypothetical protein K435DRAFT_866334 [Dendrothele bispora CBS 962.96]